MLGHSLGQRSHWLKIQAGVNKWPCPPETRAYTHTRRLAYIYTHIYTHTHCGPLTYIHIYTHTHTHTKSKNNGFSLVEDLDPNIRSWSNIWLRKWPRSSAHSSPALYYIWSRLTLRSPWYLFWIKMEIKWLSLFFIRFEFAGYTLKILNRWKYSNMTINGYRV